MAALHYGTETVTLAADADLEKLTAEIRRAAREGGGWVTVTGTRGNRSIFVSVGQYIWIDDAVSSAKGRVIAL